MAAIDEEFCAIPSAPHSPCDRASSSRKSSNDDDDDDDFKLSSSRRRRLDVSVRRAETTT